MRRLVIGALMMTLLCLLSGCKSDTVSIGEQVKERYDAAGIVSAQAVVSCTYEGLLRNYTMTCTGDGSGLYTVEVLEPAHLAGVSASFDGEDQSLSYGDLCLDAGNVSPEKISPAAVLPRVIEALSVGYVLEEKRETRNGEPCQYITLDTTGHTGKILYSIWMDESCTPCYVEISTENEIIYTVEFTKFQFNAILN